MAPSARRPRSSVRDDERTGRLVTVLFAVGLVLFGYGTAATVGLLPVGWGVVAVGQYELMAFGGLLVGVNGVVIGWRRRRPEAPFSREVLLVVVPVSLVASVLLTLVPYWYRVGALAIPPFLGWTVLGLAVVGLQLLVGTVEPAGRRRALLVLEAIVVATLAFGFLAVDRRGIENLASYLLVSGGAAAVLLLFGGPLVALGHRLVGSTG